MIEHEPDPLRRIPTQHTIDLHAEVGAVLRAARLKRGQSIEAVAQQTRIPKRYLESLENDRLDEFPAFVYMRGFLKGYCEHLDVSFDELWAKVQPPVPSSSAPAATASAPAAAPASGQPAARATPAPTHAPAAAPASTSAPAPGGSSATGAVVFALALTVGLGVWMFKDRGAAPAARPAESTPRALMPLPRTTEPKVGLRAVDDAWVRVAVDDVVVFEGRIPRGAAMEWTPSRAVALRTTAASSLQLTVNGTPRTLANPSPDGEYRIDLP
jgi:transcriptional regulator with XRE-family HTH domain